MNLKLSRNERWIKDKASLDKMRKERIATLIQYKGGQCQICGYNRHQAGLDFHHIDPNSKLFNMGTGMSRQWHVLTREADKCILLCSNCHRELHANQCIVFKDKEPNLFD
jgi:hypothetical protein